MKQHPIQPIEEVNRVLRFAGGEENMNAWLEFIKAVGRTTKAMIDLERELRVVSLYMPATAPWPWNTWWGPRLYPLQAKLTMAFAKIELEESGIYLNEGGQQRRNE